MAPPAVDLSTEKDYIRALYVDQRMSLDGIARLLTKRLGRRITLRTLQRRLREWDIKLRTRAEVTEDLRDDIVESFYGRATRNDNDLLQEMRFKRHQVNRKTVVQLRNELVGPVRLRKETHHDADSLALELVGEELRGDASEYGREHMRTHMRQMGYNIARLYNIRKPFLIPDSEINSMISSSRIQRAVKAIDPKGVRDRATMAKRRRVPRSYPGPNYLWALDGYNKLDFVGIQIYAGVDAFSRKIQWLYVGASAHTQVSVVRSYLMTIRELGIMPEILRTDMGSETPMLADAHFSLRVDNDHLRDRAASCTIPYRNHGADTDSTELSLEHCFYYGKSTRNLSIESYWGQLAKSKLNPWIAFFKEMAEDRLLLDHPRDKIAAIAIYMPIIRRLAAEFVANWNAHRIRVQPTKEHIIDGRSPYQLWENPPDGFRSFGLTPNVNLIDALEEYVIGWDPEPYLPQETLDWCHTFLISRGFPLPVNAKTNHYTNLGEKLHKAAYRSLRQALDRHMAGGNFQPALGLLQPPINGYRWRPLPANVQQAHNAMVHLDPLASDGDSDSETEVADQDQEMSDTEG